MKTTLGKVAEIRTLMIFRDKAPAEVEDGNARIISIRDIASNWPPRFEELPSIHVSELQLSQQLQPFDIIMPARGVSYPARIILNPPLPLFPVGQIHVIRTSTEHVLPAFLSWYLNTPEAQTMIASLISGAAIQALNKSSLQEIEVSIPSSEAQHQIVHLQRLLDERQRLMREIDRLTSIEVQISCLSLLGNLQ